MLKRFVNPNILITLGFLALAIAVVVQAYRWPFRSGLFPLLAGWLLLVFSALKLFLDVIAAMRPVVKPVPLGPAADGEEEEEEEDVFHTASTAEWLRAFGWMALFFAGLWLLGALVGIPAFALVYLLVASRESPVLAGAYAFACWLFVYGLFDRGLHVPLPAGVLLTSLGL